MLLSLIIQEEKSLGREKDLLDLENLKLEYNQLKRGLAKNLIYNTNAPQFSKYIVLF